LKSGSLNLLEPSGPVQACNGIAFLWKYTALQAEKGYEKWHTALDVVGAGFE